MTTFIIWCVSTCIWTTTEEPRFQAPRSFLMRLSTTEVRCICIQGSSMHTECLQHCNSFLSHCCHLQNGSSQPPTTVLPLGTFGILPFTCHRTAHSSLSTPEGYPYNPSFWRKGASSLTSLTKQRSEAAVRCKTPHSCCHTPDLTSLITSQVSLTTPSLTPSTLQASKTDKINNQHGGGSRPGPD